MGRPPGKLTKKQRKQQRAKRDTAREASTQYANDDQVLTFEQWLRLNNISASTGKRILGSGACRYVQLSERRKGVRVGDDRAWKESCARGEE